MQLKIPDDLDSHAPCQSDVIATGELPTAGFHSPRAASGSSGGAENVISHYRFTNTDCR